MFIAQLHAERFISMATGRTSESYGKRRAESLNQGQFGVGNLANRQRYAD